MKQLLLHVFIILLFTGSYSSVNAQTPLEGVTEMGDTLVIKATFNGNPVNALNEWILWDHDGNFGNTPKHSVYKLLRNQRYPITTTVNVNGRTTLVADIPDLNNKPPQVGIMDDIHGNSPDVMFAGGPFTFSNIWFMHLNYSTLTNSKWGMIANLEVDNTSNYIDGCYMEHVRAMFMKATTGKSNSIYFTNNFFNDGGKGGTNIWEGHFFNSENHTQDSIVFRNNTFINTPGILLNVRKNMTRYVEISNNTMINTCAYPYFTTFWIKGIIKNNLMWNVFSAGEEESERIKQEPDALAYSMINIDTLANEFTMTDEEWLDKESERSLALSYNYYGWRDDIEAFWATDNEIHAPQWMNSRTEAMFADDINYPLLTEEKTFTKADLGVPEFESSIKGTDDMVQFIKDVLWGDTPQPGFRYVWEPSGASIPNADLDWPPLEDLRLKNFVFRGDDGKPLGDLNWYPETAVRWDMTGWNREGPYISVDETPSSNIEVQSYPNPFVNETTIAFNLEENQKVRISVLDCSGKNVAILYNANKSSGFHSIKWDGIDNNGIKVSPGFYFVRIELNDGVITHKLLKH
ncbi:MAG: T9SS type A sorting domain-containing protein [Bacteroidales bacterium]|nr:T9SS type A sorting domain-containing protein [Bacteroidales bacterium]